MQELAIKDLTENFFEAIGKEWMLVTSGSKEKFNTMTASWGGIGFLWNKAVAFIFIRPERYTYEFIEKNDMRHFLSWVVVTVLYTTFVEVNPGVIQTKSKRADCFP